MKWFLVILSLIITHSNLCLTQTSGSVGIFFEGRVRFILTDSLGRRTGYDPRNGAIYGEIPYGVGGLETDYSEDPNDPIIDIQPFEFNTPNEDPTFRARYTLEVVAISRGIYKGGVSLSQTISGKGEDVDLKVVLDSLESVFYEIVYMTDSTQTPTLTKVVDTTTLRQDLNNCYNLNLIRNQTLYANLSTELHNIDSLLALGNIASARYRLLQFTILIDRASGDTTKIMPDGYQILREDVNVLFSNLPPGTVPSTPVPFYTLTVDVTGSGTVTKNPNQPTYDSASTVQITAIPDAGSCFLGWSGDATGLENPVSVTMHGSGSVTATFATLEDLALENKSCSANATATNNARHSVKTDSYLHHVFVSGGEVFYRRSDNGGSSWDITRRVNTAYGNNSLPCIATTQSGSLHIVWQKEAAPSMYDILYSSSSDGGESWSEPTLLPDAERVEVTQYQPEGVMPLIAGVGNKDLVVVYCSQEGLRYRISGDDGENWQVPNPDVISGQYNDRVRFPSLIGSENYASLVYDYTNDNKGPYSRVYDMSEWSEEVSFGPETGTESGAFTSVATVTGEYPIAAWSAQRPWSRSVVFRAGYPDNNWSDWFVEFWGGQNSPDWTHPSITYYNRDGSGQFGIAIVHHTSEDVVRLIRYDDTVDPPSWGMFDLGEAALWGTITHDGYSSGQPVFSWTDQGSFPHQIAVGSVEGYSPVKGRKAIPLLQKRRAVVYHHNLRATLSLEVAPLKVVLASGDTSVVPFKPGSLRQRGEIHLSNMWQYLGSGTVRLPADARRLVISKTFDERGPNIAQRKFFLRVHDTKGDPIGVLDTVSTSGTRSLNIASYAGKDVVFRPEVVLVGITPPAVKIGVGDIFVASETKSKPSKEKSRKK
jgi:hypothetical protein